jgi:hypothetical protein
MIKLKKVIDTHSLSNKFDIWIDDRRYHPIIKKMFKTDFKKELKKSL